MKMMKKKKKPTFGLRTEKTEEFIKILDQKQTSTFALRTKNIEEFIKITREYYVLLQQSRT